MSDQQFPNQQLLVSPEWLAEHLQDADLRVVEVTPPGAGYRIGHIPGAVYLSLDQVFTGELLDVPNTLGDPEKIAAILGGLGISPDKQVVICDENTGTRAARAFWLLELLGFERVAVLEGGMERWMAEGRRSTRLVPEITPVEFKPKLQNERLAEADWILARLNDGQTVLVDCRDNEEFAEGHIPGAIHRPWESSQTRHAYLGLAEPAQLQAELGAAGIAPDKEIVTYCGTGVRSAHTYFTLRALGYGRVRNYNGSWNEWGARPDLPRG